MQKFVLLYIIAFCGSVLITSCGSEQGREKETNTEVKVEQNDSLQKKSFVYTKYELPLSINVFKFLKSKKIDFNSKYMHNLKQKDKYFTEINRAQILGVYSSDLAYSTIYDKSQESVDYFGVAIDLAYKLNIEEGYESELLDEAYDNIDNTNTLSRIASDAYLRTCTTLEATNRENVLPFIVLGSWLESIYILSHACVGSSPKDGIFIELYEQKKHLEGMITYLNDILNSENNNGKDEIKSMLQMLKKLQAEYNKVDSTNLDSLDVEKLKGVIVVIQEIRSKLI